ncbi:MAG: hypothetical protein WA705_26670 [Candidatus Ozemobacteraceae bacterium]
MMVALAGKEGARQSTSGFEGSTRENVPTLQLHWYFIGVPSGSKASTRREITEFAGVESGAMNDFTIGELFIRFPPVPTLIGRVAPARPPLPSDTFTEIVAYVSISGAFQICVEISPSGKKPPDVQLQEYVSLSPSMSWPVAVKWTFPPLAISR